MLLKKQIQFDLTNFFLNKFKFIVYFLMISSLVLSIAYGYNTPKYCMVANLYIIMINFYVFNFSVSTTYERNQCEFTINKLVYFPTTKLTIFCSRFIMTSILTIFMILSLVLGYYLGCQMGNNTLEISIIAYLVKFIILLMVFNIFMSFGSSTVRFLTVISCIELPIICMIILNANLKKFDIKDCVALFILIGINIIFSLINYCIINRN